MLNTPTDRFTYPVCLVAFLLVAYSHLIARRYRMFRQDLIDAEYVVEERVENYDNQTNAKGETVIKDSEVEAPSRDDVAAGTDTDDEWEDLDN